MRSARIPGNDSGRQRPRCGAFTNIELLVVIAIIAVLIGLLLPAVQKVREAANRSHAVGSARVILNGLFTYLDAHGKMPSGLGELSGILEESLVLGLKDGYDYSFEMISPDVVRVVARPALIGLTGAEDVWIEGSIQTRNVGEPVFPPSPGADEARQALLADIQQSSIGAIREILSADQTGSTANAMKAYLCDPAHISKAFADLDENGDGRVTIAEIRSPKLGRFDGLSPVLETMTAKLQLGFANEDVSAIVGVSSGDPSVVCALNLSGEFHRGDSNSDGAVDISDAVAIFSYLFLGGTTPTCLEAANANNDAKVDISDGIYLLSFLFSGGPKPPSPGAPPSACGVDPDGADASLGCGSYDRC